MVNKCFMICLGNMADYYFAGIMTTWFIVFMSYFLASIWETNSKVRLKWNRWKIFLPLKVFSHWSGSSLVKRHWWLCLQPTPRIHYSYHYYSFCYYYVTKSVKWQYLGNQAWYHRSAGVKTTEKILNKKIKKMVLNGAKWSKMVQNGPNSQNVQKCQKWSKRSKMVQNGPKWSKMVPSGPKWWKMVKMVKMVKNGQKWGDWP